MNPRQALDNPAAAIAVHWGSPEQCPHLPEIERLASEWQSLKPDQKTLQAEKGAYSRKIGEARAAGSDIEPLKQAVAAVSVRLKEIDEQRKGLESAIAALFAPPPEAQSETVPERFRAWAGREHAAPLRIELCEEAGRTAWDAYVISHPRASLYHRYAWRDVIRTSFKHPSFYWQAVDSAGRIVGILPVVRLSSRLFGDFAVSLPYFNYGGVLGDNATVERALLKHVSFWGERERLEHIELRHTQTVATWPVREDKASMIRPLPPSVEQLDAEVGAKIRAQIKQARRHQPHVRTGGIELLDDFYRVFAANMRDLGTPVYSKQFFATILATWGEQATLIVVDAPRPVAAAFLLGSGDLLEIPWASTLRAANPMNMNMFLYWQVLSFAIDKRYAFFDFGRSSIEAGTYQFKKQWGARPVQHYWHYWLPEGTELPRLSPNNPKFRLAIALWRRLPLSVTTSLGPHLVKYLP